MEPEIITSKMDAPGFKQLTLTNWTEPDPVNAHFARVSPISGVVPMQASDWARAFLDAELKGHVPAEIRNLFTVAQGAMLYGWFFYPLFHLGEQQLYRVCEAAALARYEQLAGPQTRLTFNVAITRLVDQGAIHPDDVERWHAVRQLRNAGSHPRQQSVMPPGHVLRVLEATAHDINRLFARGRGYNPAT